jgi:hydrogenase nickel incorporation protein HypB
MPTSAHDHLHKQREESHHTIAIHAQLLAHNDEHARRNRQRFQEHGVVVVNLLSSPGSGKTLLLERTLDDLAGRIRLAVITGDLQTDNDARRLRGKGAPIVPITTGTLCHLEASMVERACAGLDLTTIDLLFIENVGNLVCPAAFDLGEGLRVVMLSTTEGEDKPLKYPLAFKTAQVVIVSKTDLAEAAGFQRQEALQNIRNVAPQARVLELSARTRLGLEAWYECLQAIRK